MEVGIGNANTLFINALTQFIKSKLSKEYNLSIKQKTLSLKISVMFINANHYIG